MSTPPTADDNCGYPGGVPHPHVDACYRAGYARGRADTLAEFREIVQAALAVVRPVVQSAVAAARRLGVIDR